MKKTTKTNKTLESLEKISTKIDIGVDIETYSSFIEIFLKENPELAFMTDAGVLLQDYIKAFQILKTKGDIPTSQGSFLYNTFQSCLYSAFSERSAVRIKWAQ